MAVRSAREKAPAGDRPFFQGTAAEVLGDIQRVCGARRLATSSSTRSVPDLKAVLANMDRFANDVRPKAKRVRARELATPSDPATKRGG